MNNGLVTENRSSIKIPRYRYFLALFLILVLVSVVVLTSVRVDKIIMEPGSAVSTEESITINGAQQFETQSDVRFLTVLVSANRPSLAAYLKARFIDTDSEITDWQDVNGDLTPSASTEINRALMLASQGASSTVALERLGCKVPRSGTGAVVLDIGPDTPAGNSALEPGDTIVKINDLAVRLHQDAVDELSSFPPGKTVSIVYENADKETNTIDVELGTHPDEENTGGFLGVLLATRDLKFKYPVDIKFDSGGVSGPSAGLAFTIHIIDRLTEGNLAGAISVAATGEITLEGIVRPVGGIKQKAIAAKDAGAKIMLVPEGEGGQARKNAGSMKVVEVGSIQDALDVLADNGGEPLAQMQTCPAS